MRSREHADVLGQRLTSLQHELFDEERTRLALRPVIDQLTAPSEASPPSPAPVGSRPGPGRHAARRVSVEPFQHRVGGLLPSGLRGQLAIGPAHVAVVAVLISICSLITAAVLVRGADEPLPTAATAPGPTPAEDLVVVPADTGIEPPAGADTATQPAGEVTIDVTGRVRRPGVVQLTSGSRVMDALDAAGGAKRGVDLSSLNLARILVDGEQIRVGIDEGAAPPGAGTPSVQTAPTGDPALVNLNSSTALQLEALPEVGPVTAAAIVEWRDTNGPFTTVDELLEVSGIGEITLAKIAPHATV